MSLGRICKYIIKKIFEYYCIKSTVGWACTDIEKSWVRIPLDVVFNHDKSSYTSISGNSQGAPAARYPRFRTNNKEHFWLKSCDARSIFTFLGFVNILSRARRDLNFQNLGILVQIPKSNGGFSWKVRDF